MFQGWKADRPGKCLRVAHSCFGQDLQGEASQRSRWMLGSYRHGGRHPIFNMLVIRQELQKNTPCHLALQSTSLSTNLYTLGSTFFEIQSRICFAFCLVCYFWFTVLCQSTQETSVLLSPWSPEAPSCSSQVYSPIVALIRVFCFAVFSLATSERKPHSLLYLRIPCNFMSLRNHPGVSAKGIS